MAKKLVLCIGYSSEQLQDSFIPMVNMYRERTVLQYAV